MEEFFSQIPRHLTLKKTPQQAKKTNKKTQKTHLSALAHRMGRQTPIRRTKARRRMLWGAWSRKAYVLSTWPRRLVHVYFEKVTFVTLSPLKADDFSPGQVKTFPINTAFLIHNFSLRNRAVQGEGDSRSQGGVISSPIFLQGMF